MPREKSRYRERDRRSSSRSSESSYERKKSKSKHKRRSRSRDKSESSSSLRRKRSTSRSRQRRKSHSRSASRDHYEKSRRRSLSRSRSKKDRSHSRSSSRSRSKYNKKRPLPSRIVNLDDTESKVEKAIKAAEAAGLTMTKIPTYEYREVEIKEDMPTIHDRNLLAELNSDSFIPKTFTSSRSNKKESKNIVIDLDTETVKVPESEVKQKDDCIFDLDELPSEEELKEMWIQKLCTYRKRMLQGET